LKHFIALLGVLLGISVFGEGITQEQTLDIILSALGQLEIRHALVEAEVAKLEKQLPEIEKRCFAGTIEEGHRMAVEYQPTLRTILKRIDALDLEDVQVVSRLMLFKPALPKQENLSQNLTALLAKVTSIQTKDRHKKLIKELTQFSYDLQPNDTLVEVVSILAYRLAMEKLTVQWIYLRSLFIMDCLQQKELSPSLAAKADNFVIKHLHTLSKGQKLSQKEIFQSMDTCLKAQSKKQQEFKDMMPRIYQLDKNRQELDEVLRRVDLMLTPHDGDDEQVLLNKATSSLKSGRYDNAINCFERYRKIRKEPGGEEFCASAIAMVKAVRDQKHNASLMVFHVPEGTEKFGFRCGDFIIALNDIPIHSLNQYMQLRDNHKDASVTFTILRLDGNGVFQTIKMPFDSFPRGFYICNIIPE